MEGRVSDSVTGSTLSKASVSLYKVGVRLIPARVSTTDGSGRFSFEGIEPGTYTLQAERNGYFPEFFGTSLRSESGTPVALSEKQELKGLDFKLLPQASITGVVIDDLGEPVELARVDVFTVVGSGVGDSAGTSVSDDIGEFRIAGLRPGRYIARATPIMRPSDPDFTGGTGTKEHGEPRQAQVPTYYPSALDAVAAAPLEVSPGLHLSGVAIVVRKRPVYSIQGKLWIVSPDIRPADVRLELSPVGAAREGGAAMQVVSTGAVRPDGLFVVQGVGGRSYYLTALHNTRGREMLGRVRVDLAATDVKGLVITIGDPVKVSGRITVEGPKELNYSAIRIQLLPLSGLRTNLRDAVPNADGSFTVQRVAPDRYFIGLSGIPEGTYLKSIRVGHADLPEAGLDLEAGSPVGALELLVSEKAGVVEGRLTDENGLPAMGVLTLVPDPPRPSLAFELKSTRSDPEGRFRFSAVAPGDYRLYTITVPLFDYLSGIAPHEARGTRLSVGEGERETVDLSLVDSGKAAAR